MTQLPASKLLGLPFELHECISILLPPGSIASLIKANCQLRLIHEKTLYHHINLYGKPGRSVRLLRTFASRPDLALLVHSLEITFSWIYFAMSGGSRVISPSHLAHLNALALARNIKSFGLRGADWSSHQKMAPIREIISKMELTSLQIFASVSSYGEQQEWILANLRLALQGQPTLQDLTFKFPGYRGDVPNGLESSDIPSLRTLRAQALTLVSISPVAIGDQLKSVEVLNWRKIWNEFLVSSFSRLPEIRQKVRKLQLFVEWDWGRGWDFDFGQVLEMFPNLDSLRIKGEYFLRDEGSTRRQELMDALLEKVASQITQSLKLTKIEVALRIEYIVRIKCVNDVTEDLKRSLKSSCPSLKTFIDSGKREWAFLSDEEEGRSKNFRVVKMGEVFRGFTYGNDLGALGTGSVNSIWD